MSIESLGELNDNQKRLLDVICDPERAENGALWAETPADVAAEYDDTFTGYQGFDTYNEAQRIADILRSHYGENLLDGAGEFTFGFDASPDGDISMFTIGVYLGHGTGMFLISAHDVKYVTRDREATGLRAALSYAEALDDEYQSVLAKARAAGLLPDGVATDPAEPGQDNAQPTSQVAPDVPVDDQVERCAADDCNDDPTDNEGHDGYCGYHAGKVEAHSAGEHQTVPASDSGSDDDCPLCD